MLIGLEICCFTVWLEIPDAQALSVCIGISACGCPISMRAVHSGMPSRALWNRAASSASIDDAIAAIGEGVVDVLVGRSPRKKAPPTRLRACASERYTSSL
jgi:hypothetical protein